MASLPLYHSVPTSPTMEKAPISPNEAASIESTGLHLGGSNPTLVTRAKDKYNSLSKVKKTLVFAGLLWFLLAAAHKTAHFSTRHHGHHGLNSFENDHGHGHGHKHEHGLHGESHEHGHGHGRPHFDKDEELTLVPTTFGDVSHINILDEVYSTANATFPIKFSRHRHFDLKFEGIEGNVIVSRSDVEDEDRHMAQVVVESVWTGLAGDVLMKTGEHTDHLTLTASDSETEAFHTVHVILPSNKRRVSSLSLSSTKSLALTIDPSAEDVHFRHLSVKSENGAIDLASVVGGEIELETVAGDVTGTFNVSRKLILKTITGSIDAKVNVHPIFPPPHHKNGTHLRPPHKKGDKHFRPEHHEDNDNEDEHKHEHGHKSHHHDKKHEHEQRVSSEKFDVERSERRGDCHKSRQAGASSWWPFRLFSKDKKGPKGLKGDKGPPPPPAFIGAFSTTGSVKIVIEHQPPFVSSIVKAFSHTGDVKVKAAKSFKGFYEAGTFKGSYDVSVLEGWKKEKIIKEIVGETGGLQKGLVFPKHHHNHTHHGHNFTETETESEEKLERRQFDEEEKSEEKFDFDFNFDNEDDDATPPPPPPPGKGPKGPGGPPPPPPGKGKGPGGPPPKDPKGPKGPGGAPPPPGGKKHPHPPPPGHSKIIAHTDVGDVTLVL